jgi:tetratricopeptide (TPR) repeat protein
MPPEAVAWGWPVAVLAAGLVLGAFLIWRMRRAAPSAAAAHVPVELRDLDGRLDVLIRQLHELQDLAATRSPEQLARERYALELQAAEVWRERERSAPAAAHARKAKAAPAAAGQGAEPAGAGNGASRTGLRGFLWGAGTAAALGLLLFYVGRTAKPREEGGSATGNLPSRGGSAAGGEEAAGGEGTGEDAAQEAEIRAALKANPDDLDARLDLAMLHLRKRELMAVWEETQYVLGKQPGHPRALSYQALVRLAMGQGDVAERMLKQALATDPNLFEAYLHLALVETRLGRDQEAQAAVDEASRRFPDRADVLARLLPQIRGAAGREGPAPVQGDPHAAVPPPSGSAGAETSAAPSGGAAAPAAGPALAGVIELPSSLASRVGPNAVVFVTVRESGTTGGPPVAVKRLPAAFPLRFAIGPGDSMMGQALPARARLEARVDSDGDPLTRDAKDPKAQLDGVAAGSSLLRLVLE